MAQRARPPAATTRAAAAPPEPGRPEEPLVRVEAWFAGRGWTAFPFQREVWAAYLAGRGGLLHAATGTGKTLAAWMGPVMEAIADPASAGARRGLRVLWLTPLRALAADTVASLQAPLPDLGVRWEVERRTADTSASVRARQSAELPAGLVTTPESLCLLLSRPDAGKVFSHLRCVVADEWHELMGGKRGVQAELALARLRRMVPGLRTWGISATLGNLDEAMAALTGMAPAAPSAGSSIRAVAGRQPDDTPPHPAGCAVRPLRPAGGEGQPGAAGDCRSPPTVGTTLAPVLVRGREPKRVTVETLLPDEVERFPWSGHLRSPLLPKLAALLDGAAGSSLVFCNTRSQAELWYQSLLALRPGWAGTIALHHGSLDRKVRDWVEAGLKAGRLRCVVCTSSLDLGVDFTPVELVVQVGSPKGVARLLQRAGRSGHRPGAESRLVCVPTNTLELVDLAAAGDAVAAGRVEARRSPDKPLDVLVQHVVTLACGEGFREADLLAEVRTARAFRDLDDDEWAWVLDFAARGGPKLRAYPEHHRILPDAAGVFRIRDEALARRHRMSVGTIASDVAVTVQYQTGGRLGTVEEGFLSRLRPGDAFVLAGRVVELLHVRAGTAVVKKTKRTDGIVPSWQGSRMPLSTELAEAVRARLELARQGRYEGPELAAVREVLELQRRWSALPAPDELLMEVLEDREGHHLFVYPVEGRLVHEGLAAVLAARLARLLPTSFTTACNDYGIELLSPRPIPVAEALDGGLFRTDTLTEDIAAGVNLGEMSRRQFREIARVAGLISTGLPGERRSGRALQAGSDLFFDTFRTWDPGNPLLHQARREVLERQLDHSRLADVLRRLAACRPLVVTLKRPGPLAFPLLVDRMRDRISNEKLADRVKRMQGVLERAADATGAPSRKAGPRVKGPADGGSMTIQKSQGRKRGHAAGVQATTSES